jgi:bifunctional DNase/RNase
MVQVRIAGVALDVRGQHVILLKPVEEIPGAGKVLPIWIGAMESSSILIAIQGAETARPLSHDLMKTLVESLGAAVDRIEVTRIEEGTFYAELTVRAPNGEHVIDCRPSDAIALAARLGVPIEVADDVLESAGVEDEFTGDEAEDVEENVSEFRHFLDTVDPSDFQSGSG